MRVLYVSHTGEIAGGERSLLTLLGGLPRDVEAVVAAPDGALQVELRKLGVTMERIAGTRASLRLSPAAMGIAALELTRSRNEVRELVRRIRPDVVHANSLRAGLLCATAGIRPLVVSTRDVLPRTHRAVVAQRFVARRADRVLANSTFTAAHVRDATGREPTVVYPPVEVARIAAAKRRPGLPTLAVLGQITPWKGQLEAIEAFAILRLRFPTAQLQIVGEAKFTGGRWDNETYAADLRAAVARAGLDDAVEFLGEREDVTEVLAAVDVLLVPSWEEPFGRVVVEGMAAGCAVVATDCGGPAEVIEDGIDGFLVGPRRPTAWAAVVADLLDDPDRRARVGRAAAESAKRFDVAVHATRLFELYSELAA